MQNRPDVKNCVEDHQTKKFENNLGIYIEKLLELWEISLPFSPVDKMQSFFPNEVPVLLRYNYPQFFGHEINFPKVEKVNKECEPMNHPLSIPTPIPPPSHSQPPPPPQPVPQKGSKPFSCEVCGKAYAQKVSLENHMISHTGKKKEHLIKPYPCEICGKGFTQKGNMKTHMLTHTVGKQHLCPVCGKGFTQKGNMKTHMKLHQRVPDSDKPFNCHICGHGFQLRSSLDCHLSNHEKYLGQRYQGGTSTLATPGGGGGGGLPNMQNMAAIAAGMQPSPNISSPTAPSSINVPNSVSSQQQQQQQQQHHESSKANNHHNQHSPQSQQEEQQHRQQQQQQQQQLLHSQLQHYKSQNSLHAAVKQAYNEINNYNQQ